MRIIGRLAVLGCLLAGGGVAAERASMPPAAYTQSHLADRAQIEDVISAFAINVDRRRWREAQALVADRIELGFPAGDDPSQLQVRQMTAAEFIAASQSQLPGFLHTQHMVTNPVITVDRDRANVTSQMQLSHFLPNEEGEPFWTVVGMYEYGLVRAKTGWKISRMDVHKLFELGNRKLPELAARRVKAGQIATQP